MIHKFLKIFIGFLISIGFVSFAFGQTTFLFPNRGGTGTTSTPISGQTLIGNSSNTYTPAYITGGDLITITTSSGGITISGTSTASTGSFTNLSFTNATGTQLALTGLTANRLVRTIANGLLQAVTALTDWIKSPNGDITVTDNGDGTVNLSLPQRLFTTSSPQFGGLTLTGDLLPSGSVNIGASGNRFANGYFTNLDTNLMTINTATVGDLVINNGNVNIASNTKAYQIGGSNVLTTSSLNVASATFSNISNQVIPFFKTGGTLAQDATNLQWDYSSTSLSLGNKQFAHTRKNPMLVVRNDPTSNYSVTDMLAGGEIAQFQQATNNTSYLAGLRLTNFNAQGAIGLTYDGSGLGSLVLGTSNNGSGTPVPIFERMRIKYDGNIGIATTTPAALFTVATSSNSTYFAVTNAGNVGIGLSGPTSTLSVIGSSTISGAFTVGPQNLYVQTNGNIGVGTSTPAVLLHLGSKGTKQGYLRFENGTNANREANIYNDTNGGLRIDTNTNLYPIYFDGSAVSISSKVGIGTSTPASQLVIQQFAAALSTGPMIRLVRDTGASGMFGSAIYEGFNTNNKEAMVFAVGANADITALAQAKMAIQADGTVGIATTTPQSTLQLGTPKDATASYLQLDILTSNPAATDCDVAAEAGKSAYVSSTNTFALWSCIGPRWVQLATSTF